MKEPQDFDGPFRASRDDDQLQVGNAASEADEAPPEDFLFAAVGAAGDQYTPMRRKEELFAKAGERAFLRDRRSDIEFQVPRLPQSIWGDAEGKEPLGFTGRLRIDGMKRIERRLKQETQAAIGPE